jgi:hypothetical protein
VRRPQQAIRVGGLDADHECRTDDAAAHASANHERDPAEHPPLGDIAPIAQEGSNPVG